MTRADEDRRVSRARLRQNWWILLVIILAGTGISAGAFFLARSADEGRIRAELELRAEWRANEFQRNLLLAAESAEGLAVYMAAEGQVSAARFHTYAKLAHGDDDFNSALYWSPLVADGEREAFLARARQEVGPDYDIREIAPDDSFVPAAQRAVYLPQLYEEPYDGAPGIAGFDLLFRPQRRAEIERIRDEGAPLATATYQLLMGDKRVPGFLVHWPVYGQDVVPPTVEERRAAFRGVATARLRLDRFLPAAIKNTPRLDEAIDISIGSDKGELQSVARFDPATQNFVLGPAGAAPTNGVMTARRAFTVLKQNWLLVSYFPPAFVSQLRSSQPWAWLAFGLFLTGLITMGAERERWRRTGVEQLVAERTGELVTANRTLSQEIVERRQAETEARRSQALLKATFDASPVAIVIRDTDLNILFWSRAAERIFGYTAEEVVGKYDPLIQPTFRNEQFAEWRQRAVAGEIVTGIENERNRKDGSVVQIRRTLAPIHIAGKLIGFVGLMEDVTEQNAMERQLVQAQKMEAVGNLTGGLAHDFNNLLGIIVGNLDLLLPMLAPNVQAGEIARDALDAALRGADLTRRLLAFARRQPLQPQAIDLNQLVANAARLLQRMLDANIEISLDLAPETWPVVADPAQLETSVINLATNARDAMPQGGTLSIATGNRTLDAGYCAAHPDVLPGDYALIEISDTGSGMTAEVLSHVFEPFYTTKETGKGTGLGLSMVFGFIRQSEGHISAYSEPGVGTTFRLYLPKRSSADASVTSREEPVSPSSRGEIVLVVEDNEALRRVVLRQLAELGYRTFEAADAAAALALLEQERIDLLFTDIVMPGGLDGFDLARRVLERWPSIKVVLTSGFPSTKINGHLDTQAAQARLLSKPYRKDELARILREVLDETASKGGG